MSCIAFNLDALSFVYIGLNSVHLSFKPLCFRFSHFFEDLAHVCLKNGYFFRKGSFFTEIAGLMRC